MAVAYLGSPGTCFPIPQAAYEASLKSSVDAAPLWQRVLLQVSPFPTPLQCACMAFLIAVIERMSLPVQTPDNNMEPLRPAGGGEAIYLHDGFSTTQGPSYALAKVALPPPSRGGWSILSDAESGARVRVPPCGNSPF
jgi:hypothetical protein